MYDYIVTGAGASGLSLLVHMIRSGKFGDKKILLVEQFPKVENDRTWCFWETEPGAFEEIVHKRWTKMWFHGNRSELHDISPYQYKLIRGIDFYEYCFELIGQQPNITIEYGKVEKISGEKGDTFVMFNGKKVAANYVFNSILFEKPDLGGYHFLLQHFKGWFVKTATPAFRPGEATLMDFRVDQRHGTTFVYVMPFSETEALIEYTLFSKTMLADQEYDEGLKHYCEVFLSLRDYQVEASEFGTIPMTSYPFSAGSGNVLNIGTAGGQTKASSGYTFNFIQKQSAEIAASLAGNGEPLIKEKLLNKRFNFYDTILLDILANKKLPGQKIFSTLFETNSMKKIFSFLDNQTSMQDELQIIRKLPRGIFLRSALRSL